MSWQATSLVLLSLALAGGFAWYEREKPPARVVALVAALAALAVVGRLAFAAIPNVKPTTDIVLFAGYALGAAPGFVVGSVTAVVSNVFLSQGPWTAWQMAGWGAVGIAGAVLARVMARREPNRLELATVCALAGLAFGAWMDIYQWTLAARQDLATYIAISGTSLPYNLAHGIGNFVFCLLLGPAFVRALRRYRRRLEVNWEPVSAGAGVAAVLVALAVASAAGQSGSAAADAAPATAVKARAAATATGRAVRYLLRAQNRDGGFGSAPRQRSSPLFTGWAGIGLAAAGRNPRDVHRRGGRSITSYIERGSRSLRDIGEIERTILVVEAAGLSSRRFGGRNLVAQVERRRRADGSIAGYVSYTAFGILALRAAGESVGRSTIAWLARAQNGDGGFGVAPSSVSDSDMTGAALQALAVTGRGGTAAARRAVEYLRGNQGADGGFGQMRGRSSNAQSTSYAVQGMVAVGAASGSVRRALSYLGRLQRRDGSIPYSRTSSQTPVWVTAQALAALRRKPLPLAAVARERRGDRSGRTARRDAANADGDARPASGGGGSGGGGGEGHGQTAGAESAAPADTAPSAPAAKAETGSRKTGGSASSDASGGITPERSLPESGSTARPGDGLVLDSEGGADDRDRGKGGGIPAMIVVGGVVLALGLIAVLLRRRAPRRLLLSGVRRLRRPRPTL